MIGMFSLKACYSKTHECKIQTYSHIGTVSLEKGYINKS